MGAIASRYRVHNAGLVSTDIKNVEDEKKRENPGTLDELHKKTKGKDFELFRYCKICWICIKILLESCESNFV